MFRQIHEKLTKERQLASEPCPPLLRLSPPPLKAGGRGGGGLTKEKCANKFLCYRVHTTVKIIF